jgi:uroporphyrin-3 C-methyltransferase
MTEPTDNQPAPESTPDQQPQRDDKPPARTGRTIAPLALLLSLLALALAGAGGYYLWQQLQELEARQPSLATAAAVQAQTDQLVQADQNLQQRLQAVDQDTDANAQAVNQVQQRMEQLAKTQEALQERLAQLDVQAQAQRGEWIRAEAAYLASLAVARASLQRDVDGALAALRLADELLARLSSKAIAERQAVNRAINRLVAVDMPDLAELASRIDALIDKVDLMPLDQHLDEVALAPEQSAAPAAQEPAPNDWRARVERAWERFKDTLGELVIVQRGKAVEPLLAPEERYFLYHNLRLRLEAARLALIERNETIYQRSLDRAAEWIERYYATGEPAVEEALATIAELRAVDIRPELPQLESLLETVTRY